MEKHVFTGKSLDDALAQAAKSLNTERGLLSYNVLPPSKEGGLFSKLFQRSVRLEAWVEQNQADLEEAARRAVLSAIEKKPQADRKPQPERKLPNEKHIQHERKPHNEKQQLPSNSGAPAVNDVSHQHSNVIRPKANQTDNRVLKSEGVQHKENKDHKGRRAEADNLGKKAHTPRPHAGAPGAPNRGTVAGAEIRPVQERDTRHFREKKERRPPRSTDNEVRPETDSGTEGARFRAPRTPGIDFSNEPAFASLEKFTRTFMTAYGISPENVQIEKTDAFDVNISVTDEHLESLLAKTDRLSLAFEHIFKRIAQKESGDVSARVSLDSGNARELRAEKLREMAHSMADKVRSNGKTLTIAAKSAQERRIIHMSLEGAEGVATRSVGSGDSRRLVIYSTTKPRPPKASKHPAQRRGPQEKGISGNALGTEDATSTLEAMGTDGSNVDAGTPPKKRWKRRKRTSNNRIQGAETTADDQQQEAGVKTRTPQAEG